MVSDAKVASHIGGLQLKVMQHEETIAALHAECSEYKQLLLSKSAEFDNLHARFDDLNNKSAQLLQARNIQLAAAQEEIRKLRKLDTPESSDSAVTNILTVSESESEDTNSESVKDIVDVEDSTSINS